MGGVVIYPVAESTPFDNSTNGFVSDNTQAAIEEARSNAISQNSRMAITCGFDGDAKTGRWLEFFPNNRSDELPFIVAELSKITGLTVSTKDASTGEISIFVNSVERAVVTLTAESKFSINTLDLGLVQNDEISAQIKSGNLDRVNLYTYIRTLA